MKSYISGSLYLVAETDSKTMLHLFNHPSSSLTKGEIFRIPSLSIELPAGVPNNFHIVNINKDTFNIDDLFFECNNQWHIWLSNDTSVGGYPSQTFEFPIPSEVIKITDVIEGTNDYDLLVGVETVQESDIAYYSFKREHPTYSDFSYNLIPISIPDKHIQGSTSRLFNYTDKKTGKAQTICIVYNCLDINNPQHNPFHIYELDDPEFPQLIQTFIPQRESTDIQYYFDRPVLTADFDNDGVSDIVMMSAGFPDDQSDIHHRFFAFAGIASDTTVNHWSLYE